MGAGLCIENATDRHIAVHLEQISVRYWALVPAAKRVMWSQSVTVHLDKGAYTLRAFDAASANYKPPNMKKEKAKAVAGGLLIGAGGAGLLASIPLFAVPGVALTVAGVGVVGGVVAAGVGAAAASGTKELKSGVKRGVRVGKTTKYVIRENPDKQEIEFEKVEYDEDDMDDDDTILAEEGERCINPENFSELMEELQKPTVPLQVPQVYISVKVAAEPPQDPSSPECEYFRKCQRYLETIDNYETVRGMLDKAYDKCFCEHCASKRRDKKVYEMGNPKKKFAVPWGYAKFGVKLPPNAEQLDIFDQWHVCYHGTNPSATSNIMECGRLLKPGDVNPDGSLRKPGPGRWTKETAPDGHEVNRYFFSPTPAYSELYADKKMYKDEKTGENYKAKIVLQVRIKPDSYEVGPSTVAARLRPETGPIDPNFSDDELEWMTDRECVHYIYGILIKLEKC